jgi:hypothetical protein
MLMRTDPFDELVRLTVPVPRVVTFASSGHL